MRPQTEGKPLSTTKEAPPVDQAEALNRELVECIDAQAAIAEEMRALVPTTPAHLVDDERKARFIACGATMKALTARIRELKALIAESGAQVDDVVKAHSAATASMLHTDGGRIAEQGVRFKRIAAAIRGLSAPRPAVRVPHQKPRAARTRRQRATTGASSSRGDPPAEGDPKPSRATPQACDEVADSGTGGAR